MYYVFYYDISLLNIRILYLMFSCLLISYAKLVPIMATLPKLDSALAFIVALCTQLFELLNLHILWLTLLGGFLLSYVNNLLLPFYIYF